jgi:type 2 lantibiotic biosynthesis protein LanM
MNLVKDDVAISSTTSMITQIVEKASFLYERLGPDFCLLEVPNDEEEELGRRLKAWMKLVTLGEKDQFAKRLAWDNMTSQKAMAVLHGARLREGAPLPPWARCLEDVLAIVAQFSGASREQIRQSMPCLMTDDPAPFEEVLVPFLHYWAQTIHSTDPVGDALLTDEARHCVARALLQKLSQAAGATLMLEFSAFSATTLLSNETPSHYDAFIQNFYSGGCHSLLETYPVLGRLLAETTDLYCSFINSFLLHLKEDLGSLQQELGQGKPLNKVCNIGTGLSDSHAGGTSVLRISFEGGLNCFYKPKHIGSEQAYYGLMAYLNETRALLPFRIVKTIVREDHGWAEEITEQPCPDEAAVTRYFERAGMMLCVLYLLGANDCNVENIIPAGEHPILIDTETLFQPIPNQLNKDTWAAAGVADRAMYHNSVLRVGMLPRWRSGPNGTKNDINGLGGSAEGSRGNVSRKIWESINTDSMCYAWKEVPIPSSPVLLQDKPVYAADYAHALEAGFTKLYNLFCDRRDELVRPDGPIAAMKDLPLRFLIRSTFIYYGVMHKLLLSQCQSDGIDASIQVDMLARRVLYAEDRPVAWPLIRAEANSVVQLDIPRFGFTPSEGRLRIGSDEYIDGFFVEPSFTTVMERIASLDASNLELQTSFIRSSFAAPYQNSVVEDATQIPVRHDEEPLTPQEAMSEAYRIAEHIKKAALRGRDGTVCWITHGYNADSQFWQIQPMGLRFFDGVCGTALFLAAVDQGTGGRDFHDLATATFGMLSRLPNGAIRAWTVQNGIGATLGISSLIYGLLQAAKLLQDDSFIQTATRLAEHVTEDAIASDKKLDIMGGAAGCIAVLLRLYETTKNDRLLQIALQCGEYLLLNRTEATPGLRSWATVMHKHLAGFSHGAAGIAFALLRLADASGNDRFRDAAVEAVEYEATLISESDRNWPNLLMKAKDGRYAIWNSWCHGAPGIGLGRIGSLSVLDTPSIRRDIAYALESASSAPLNSLDNVCCGTLGRVEVLLEAHRRLGSPDTLKKAQRIAKQVVRRAEQNGGYRVGAQTGVYIPAFYQGMAGVGYQLLRISDPDTYPSLLCFEQ